MEKIIMYGTRWCGDTIRARKVLDKLGIDYEYIDINKDSAGDKFVKETNHGSRSVPTIIFPDESILVEPSTNRLLEKINSLES
jgi:mycoredoxin